MHAVTFRHRVTFINSFNFQHHKIKINNKETIRGRKRGKQALELSLASSYANHDLSVRDE
jgi:hypothetical protein